MKGFHTFKQTIVVVNVSLNHYIVLYCLFKNIKRRIMKKLILCLMQKREQKFCSSFKTKTIAASVKIENFFVGKLRSAAKCFNRIYVAIRAAEIDLVSNQSCNDSSRGITRRLM